MNFERWNENAEQMFARIDQLRVHPPQGNLFDQLEFIEHVDAVFEKIGESESSRQIVLEAWLLIDYIVTYLLRDALHLPERIDRELKLLPSSFETKINLIKQLRKTEEGRLPNQKSYLAFELHPDFGSELMEDEEFYRKLIKLACQFEERTCPQGAYAVVRYDFELTRFVPEWWYKRAAMLDDEWFQDCKRLNKTRNVAAHKMKMNDDEVFREFGVTCLADFKATLRGIIERIVFRRT